MSVYAINKQAFEFNCKSEEVAKNIQKEIENFTSFQINTIIDAVLTDMVDADTLLKIEKIEIDLGDININEFGTSDMLGKFKEIFMGKISAIKNFKERENALFIDTYPVLVAESNVENELELVGAFLLNGDLPWWGDKKSNIDFDAAMQKLIIMHPESVKLFVQEQKERPEVLWRMLDQLKPATKRMMDLLIPGMLPLSLKRKVFLFDNNIFPEDFSIPEPLLDKLALFLKNNKHDPIDKLRKALLPILCQIIGLTQRNYLSLNSKSPNLDFLKRYLLISEEDKPGRKTKEQLVRFIQGLSVYQIQFLLFFSSSVLDVAIEISSIPISDPADNDSSGQLLKNSTTSEEVIKHLTPSAVNNLDNPIKISEDLRISSEQINKTINNTGRQEITTEIPPLSKNSGILFNDVDSSSGFQDQANNVAGEKKSLETKHTIRTFDSDREEEIGNMPSEVSLNEVIAPGNDTVEITVKNPVTLEFKDNDNNRELFGQSTKKHKHFLDLLKALAFLKSAHSKEAGNSRQYSFTEPSAGDKSLKTSSVDGIIPIAELSNKRSEQDERLHDLITVNTGIFSKDADSLVVLKEVESVLVPKEAENVLVQQEAESVSIRKEAENVLIRKEAENAFVQKETENTFVPNEADNTEPYVRPIVEAAIPINRASEIEETFRARKIAFIITKLNTSDPAVHYYLEQFDETELDKLDKVLKQHSLEHIKRRKMIRSIADNPNLLKYEVLKIYANIYLTKVQHVGNSHVQPGLKNAKKRGTFLSLFSKKIEIAHNALFYLIDRLPLKEIIVLSDIFQKRRCDNEEESRIIRKILHKLPEEAVLFIKFLTELPEKEIIGLISIKENKLIPGAKPEVTVLSTRQDSKTPSGELNSGQSVSTPKNESDASELKNKIDVFYKANATGKIYIENAGLCIIALYLRGLFNRLGYLVNGSFKTMAIAVRAVYITQYIVTGKKKCPEYLLQFNKILCGFKVENYISSGIRLTKKEMLESDMLLQSVVENWKALKNTSVDGFRESFMERKGILFETKLCWTLQVERKGFDLLLNTIPWGFSIIKLPWMKKHIQVEW